MEQARQKVGVPLEVPHAAATPTYTSASIPSPMERDFVAAGGYRSTTTAGAPSSPAEEPADAPPLFPEEPTPVWRLARARIAGEQAFQKLHGGRLKVKPSDPLSLQNHYYVVLRGGGRRLDRPTVLSTWVAARLLVITLAGEIDEAAVFHGFASWAEVKVYCEAAGIATPLPA